METYLDIATPEELKEIFGRTLTSEQISRKRASCQKYPDYNFRMLYLLYCDRGDKKTAKAYLDKIKDPEMRRSAA